MTEIIAVRFRVGGKEYYFDPKGVQYHLGDQLIVETAKGLDYGLCSRSNTMVEDDQVVQPLCPVVRLATEADQETLARNREREKYALDLCQQKVANHGLDMALVRCECAFDGSKLLFFFTSEGRVDFRALVRDLASSLHCRIELRQIGVRDETKLLGGLGICGRPYCCNGFLEQFHPVSIKMAKTQGLSLNPAKISGSCGRLMCCLQYEQFAYEDAVKRLPKPDSFVETPDGAGNVVSVDYLRETVRVQLEKDQEELHVYSNEEIRVIRSGKGKRPEDYVQPPLEELDKLRKTPLPVAPPSYAADPEPRRQRQEKPQPPKQEKPKAAKPKPPRKEREELPEFNKIRSRPRNNHRRHRHGGGKPEAE